MEKDETAVAQYQGAVVPMPLDEVERLGKYLAASKYFTDVTDVSQAVVKIIAGQALGFDPVYSMSKLYIVKGRVTVMAEAVAAMVKRSNRYDYKILLYTDKECSLEFSDTGKPVMTSGFTMEDAKRARLIKEGGAWNSWPRAMLFSKALLQGARIVCPHIISGIRTVEESGGYVDESGKLVLDPKQAEKDVEALWPAGEGKEEVVEGDFTTKQEEGKESEGAGSAEGEPEPEPEATNKIDMEWLRENLGLAKWYGDELREYFKTVLGVGSTGSLDEVVARLDTTQQAAFVAEVQRRLVYGQPEE